MDELCPSSTLTVLRSITRRCPFSVRARYFSHFAPIGPGGWLAWRRTSCTLIADLPELGRLDRRRIAALAGLAPLARNSGAFRGRRMIVGGRARIRRILYMATVAAIKFNPVIRTFFQRLVAAGRPGKVAITAAMRKLLTILNAMLRDRRPWQLT